MINLLKDQSLESFLAIFIINLVIFWILPFIIILTTGKIVSLNEQQLMRISSSNITWFIGSFGTIFHELGHLLAAIIFGHKINKVSFLHLPKNGKVGSVIHSYNSKSKYQVFGNTIIGIAPILSISLFLFLIYFSFENIQLPYKYLLIIIFISLTFGLNLSPSDYQSAKAGLPYWIILIFIFSVILFTTKKAATVVPLLINYFFIFSVLILGIVILIFILLKLLTFILRK
ncbi:MAG: hypothetical protein LBC17_02315 [Lactobacillaceae bacterium]|nr:hypothetical protein [Lactobacillaceae bacterium]